jgi:hypothetical protein
MLLQRNLQVMLENAEAAGVDVVIATWVYHSGEFHKLVADLAPPNSEPFRVQLRASDAVWRERFARDAVRPALDEFYEHRYFAAQPTPADHIIETDGLDVTQLPRCCREL